MSTRAPASIGPAAQVRVGDPAGRKGDLKSLGGSRSDDWNNLIAHQTFQSLCVTPMPSTADQLKNISGVLGALEGIGPKDEVEGMIAAQMIASHNAAMDSYRRAAEPGVRRDKREASLTQGASLSATCTALVEALGSHRQRAKNTE